MMSEPTTAQGLSHTEELLTDAFLRASRVLVALAARSLDESTSPVTFAQFRALLVISRGTASNQSKLAAELAVAPSSVTRMVDRLEAAEFVERHRAPGSTRGLTLRVTPKGAAVVAEVTAKRREAIAEVVGKMETSRVETLIEALEAFSDAGDEPPLDAPGGSSPAAEGFEHALDR